VYLNPDEVDIKEPPTIVNNIKNNDKFKSELYNEIPEVEIDVVTAKNTFAKPSSEITKK
tara:strand:+ start:31 stop:207 length:177 start_codon:yes stop_codon:yes gene_type:complete